MGFASQSHAAALARAMGGADAATMAAEALVYLFEQLAAGGPVAASAEAAAWTAEFKMALTSRNAGSEFAETLDGLAADPERALSGAGRLDEWPPALQ